MSRLVRILMPLSASPVVDLGRPRGAISRQDDRLVVRLSALEIWFASPFSLTGRTLGLSQARSRREVHSLS